MTMDRPKKKTEVFRAGQVEEYQIGTEFEEIECPMCDGGGEVVDEWEGVESTDVCPDCHGSGVFYIRNHS